MINETQVFYIPYARKIKKQELEMYYTITKDKDTSALADIYIKDPIIKMYNSQPHIKSQDTLNIGDVILYGVSEATLSLQNARKIVEVKKYITLDDTE